MSEQFDADYFLRGRQTGKSLYENYRWLPKLTIPMVRAIIRHCGINPHHAVLDFGCARGYVVKAFREVGYEARGVDVSEWAIRNADEETKPYLQWTYDSPPLRAEEFDWVIAKDVLEHVEFVVDQVELLQRCAHRGVFAVVPLSDVDGQPFTVPEYECDVTHLHRLTLASWARMFMRPGWRVEAAYRVVGVKDNYAEIPTGNGFLTARRLT